MTRRSWCGRFLRTEPVLIACLFCSSLAYAQQSIQDASTQRIEVARKCSAWMAENRLKLIQALHAQYRIVAYVPDDASPLRCGLSGADTVRPYAVQTIWMSPSNLGSTGKLKSENNPPPVKQDAPMQVPDYHQMQLDSAKRMKELLNSDEPGTLLNPEMQGVVDSHRIKVLLLVRAVPAFADKVKTFCIGSSEENSIVLFRNPGFSFDQAFANYRALLGSAPATQAAEMQKREKLHAMELGLSQLQEGEEQCEGLFLNGWKAFPSDGSLEQMIQETRERLKR